MSCIDGKPPTDDELADIYSDAESKMQLDFRSTLWLVDEIRQLRQDLAQANRLLEARYEAAIPDAMVKVANAQSDRIKRVEDCLDSWGGPVAVIDAGAHKMKVAILKSIREALG